MDLQSGKFYWPETLKNTPQYDVLEENIDCDVLIIGGGGSGALCAYFLSDKNLNVVVVDKRKIGMGSTATNTSLIQYIGEKFCFELVNTFGEEHAARHFKLCEQAITQIEKACSSLPINADFKRRDSLYFASYEEDLEKLHKEYNFLKKHGFSVDLWDEKEISEKYPFSKKAALYIHNDAEVNPFTLTHGLLQYAKSKGVLVYENTELTGKRLEKETSVYFTKNGNKIRAKHVIVASGYETLEFKNNVNATIESSYAIVTTPIEDFSSWYKKTLIWETARPYIYMRTTPDNRVIIGGLDETTHYKEERDSKILNKRDQLLKEFHKLFPDLKAEAEFYLGAFYGGTHDGLPIIGMYDELPNHYHIYGYGDNGTVYNTVIAEIVKDLILTGSSNDLNLYIQNRPYKLNV